MDRSSNPLKHSCVIGRQLAHQLLEFSVCDPRIAARRVAPAFDPSVWRFGRFPVAVGDRPVRGYARAGPNPASAIGLALFSGPRCAGPDSLTYCLVLPGTWQWWTVSAVSVDER